jgi:hypothetical protein
LLSTADDDLPSSLLSAAAAASATAAATSCGGGAASNYHHHRKDVLATLIRKNCLKTVLLENRLARLLTIYNRPYSQLLPSSRNRINYNILAAGYFDDYDLNRHSPFQLEFTQFIDENDNEPVHRRIDKDKLNTFLLTSGNWRPMLLCYLLFDNNDDDPFACLIDDDEQRQRRREQSQQCRRRLRYIRQLHSLLGSSSPTLFSFDGATLINALLKDILPSSSESEEESESDSMRLFKKRIAHSLYTGPFEPCLYAYLFNRPLCNRLWTSIAEQLILGSLGTELINYAVDRYYTGANINHTLTHSLSSSTTSAPMTMTATTTASAPPPPVVIPSVCLRPLTQVILR